METVDISSLFQGSNSKELQKQFIGSEQSFPPNTTGMGEEWQLKDGSLLDRTAQSQLWEWVQATQGAQLVTDADWLILEGLSPNGAVSVYSSGDGSATFRVPTVGEEGGFTRAKGTTVTDPVILNIGFQDQIQNITASLAGASNATRFTDLIGAFQGIDSVTADAGTGATTGFRVADFNASRVVRTGDETTPKGQYSVVYIYTGADTAGLAPVATLEQLLLATAQRPITYNNSLLGVVNQREFDGNWSTLSTGDYGYDGWLKYSATHKAQIVEDGDYLPSTTHVVQYDGVNVGTITSPESGHWLIAVPFSVDNIDVRAGELTVPFYTERIDLKESKCYRYLWIMPIDIFYYGVHPAVGGTTARLGAVRFPVLMHKTPSVAVSLVEYSNGLSESITVSSWTASFNVISAGNYSGISSLVADASFTIADAGTNITVVG